MHEARRERQRAGDVDALPLPAGQLVRIAVGEQRRVEPDLAQQVVRAARAPRRGEAPCTFGPNAIVSSIVSRGLSEA